MSKSKSKTQEALAFLDDLDKLGADGDTANPSVAASATAASDDRKKRSSVEVNKPLKSGAQTGGKAGGNNNSKAEKTESGDKDGKTTAEDPEAALAFLQAQIDQKRPVSRTQNAPLSRPTTPGSGAGGGVGAATIGSVIPAPTGSRRSVEVARSKAGTPDVAGTTQPTNIPSDKATSGSSSSNSGGGGGWGFSTSSLWQTAKSTASSALQQAQAAAAASTGTATGDQESSSQPPSGAPFNLSLDDLYNLRKAGSGSLEALKSQIQDRTAHLQQNLDLQKLTKLQQDILSQTTAALSGLMDAVAPPISEHEVWQVWLSHEMKGYEGVEGVVYQGIQKVGH